MVIAVDAVGGDFYPEVPVKGAVEASREKEDLQILLVGPEEMIRKQLNTLDYDEKRIHVQHASEIVEMDESPAKAVKTKRDSSLAVGLAAHKAGKCDAFISAGNTGALLAASTFLLGKLKGVSRPTIGATFPTIKGFRILIDAGANLEARPEMYIEFARMGTIYSKEVMEISDPKIGLVNVGEEEEKGTEDLREVYGMLQKLPGFVGNVEGRDILPGKADVFLCNGLIGNILLKFGESIPGALKELVSGTIQKSGLSKKEAGLVLKVLKKSTDAFNYENVGGIPFLGVDGVSMVGHGGSSATAIKNMIFNAAKCVDHNINEKIVASLNG